jgi:hypothetical protein
VLELGAHGSVKPLLSRRKRLRLLKEAPSRPGERDYNQEVMAPNGGCSQLPGKTAQRAERPYTCSPTSARSVEGARVEDAKKESAEARRRRR